MGLFKKRMSVEDFSSALILESIPRGISFFEQENNRARFRLRISEDDLKNIGAGVCLFFFSALLQENGKAGAAHTKRATTAVRRALPKIGGVPDRGQDWWKIIDEDARIIHGTGEPLEVACKAVWNRLFRDRPFNEHGSLRSFTYFLQVEIEGARKLKLV